MAGLKERRFRQGERETVYPNSLKFHGRIRPREPPRLSPICAFRLNVTK